MITVACVLRSGGFYTPEWVRKLKDGVNQNLKIQHNFVCLTDVPVDGVYCVPLQHEWPGWWSKIELFRPRLFHRPILYMDLDSIVVGDLNYLIRGSGFWMVEDYLFGPGRHNSSVMAFQPGIGDVIFHHFKSNAEYFMDLYDNQRPRGLLGDQGFIQDTLQSRSSVPISNFPNGLAVSYKKDARESIPSGASVVQFHGRPKPDTCHGWVQPIWESLGADSD